MTQYYAKKTSKTELLAPAGNLPSFKSAINAGCDAVYLGGKHFNARRKADNFSEESMKEAIQYAHLRNKKVYLTLNTLIKNSEINSLIQEVDTACKLGVDAIILQDLGALNIIRQIAPTMPLHASTQLSAHSVSDCQMLKKLGFKRVVLARELSLDEIKRISTSVDIELEVFVHGALCVSVSGQCFFSSALGERSANRGLCAGVCRLPFSHLEGTSNSTQEFRLSLKDLSYIDELKLLQDIGITSFKIEGRMKNSQYVFESVSNFKAALSESEYDKEGLSKIFSRSGFTNGYLVKNFNNMFGIRSIEDKNNTSKSSSLLSQNNSNQYFDYSPNTLLPIHMYYEFKLSENPTLTIYDDEGNVSKTIGVPTEISKNNSLETDIVNRSLFKLDDYPYAISTANGQIEPNVFYSTKNLNDLRRRALDDFTNLFTAKFIKPCYPANVQKRNIIANSNKPQNSLPYNKQQYISTIRCVSQISQELFDLSQFVSIPLFKCKLLSKELLQKNKHKIIAELPRIYFHDERNIYKELEDISKLGIKKGKAHTLGRMKILKSSDFEIFGGFGLNILNSYSIELLCNEFSPTSITMSPEILLSTLNSLSISKLHIDINLISYGRLPLMINRVCPFSYYCKTKSDKTSLPDYCASLHDRKNFSFPVLCNNKDTFEILNSHPLYIGDKIPTTKKINTFEFLFNYESMQECPSIISSFSREEKIDTFTRGCYFKKID